MPNNSSSSSSSNNNNNNSSSSKSLHLMKWLECDNNNYFLVYWEVNAAGLRLQLAVPPRGMKRVKKVPQGGGLYLGRAQEQEGWLWVSTS